jgi:hypothetical protein
MAESKTSSTKSSTATADRNGSTKGQGGIMAGAHDAADVVKATYDRAAERFPEVAETAQTAARDTQRALERMPNQGLLVGTSFSIGLGVGLFMSGANRLLVLAALAPAAAMAATLVAREEESTTAGA